MNQLLKKTTAAEARANTNERRLYIDLDVPWIDGRGQPESEESRTLLTIPVGASFVTKKKRDSMYQLSYYLEMKIHVGLEGYDKNGCQLWRIHKKSEVGAYPGKKGRTALFKKRQTKKPTGNKA
jgi:hypothetical protein